MKAVHTLAALGAVALVGFWGTASHGAVITSPGSTSFVTQQDPDVNLDFELVNYTISGSTATLTVSVSGDVGELSLPAVSSVTDGAISLTVNFTKNGSAFQATSGSIDVSGTLGSTPHDFFNSTSLLEFGFTESAEQPQTLAFLFGPGTGDYGSSEIGMFVHTPISVVPDSNFDAAFTNSGASQESATSDTFSMGAGSPPPVPEPASLALIGLAAPVLMLRRRRRLA